MAGGGGRRRKADTELKTKTPHVNVGKNLIKVATETVSFVLSASLICLRLPLLNPPLKISQKILELGCVLRQSFMLRNMPIVSASFSLPRLNLMLGSRIMRSLCIGAMGLLLKLLRKKLVGPLLFGGKRKMCGSDMSSQAASARGMPVSTRRSLLLFSSLLTATMWLWFLLKVNLFLHLGSKKLWTSSSTFLVLDGPILQKLYSFGSYCVFCKCFLSFVSTEEKTSRLAIRGYSLCSHPLRVGFIPCSYWSVCPT